MFNITDFIMNTLKEMKGNYPDFQIKEYALNWYAKGKLNEEHLAELEEYLAVSKEESVEEFIEELTEESAENTEI